MCKKRFLICLLLSFYCLPGSSEEIRVAVASNFAAAMNEIVNEFEQTSGHTVHLSFGSSGKFFAQLKHGAPFHLFFSADQVKPLALEQEGLAVAGSRFTYALGALVLWSRTLELSDKGVNILRSGEFNKLALANPRLAPYGVAAEEVLTNLQLREITKPKWVQGENIAQTWQFVHSGNAELGFVAMSQIVYQENDVGFVWMVPSNLYNPIRQDAVLLRTGESSRAARELLDFVRSEQAKKIIEAYGYTTITEQTSVLE